MISSCTKVTIAEQDIVVVIGSVVLAGGAANMLVVNLTFAVKVFCCNALLTICFFTKLETVSDHLHRNKLAQWPSSI